VRCPFCGSKLKKFKEGWRGRRCVARFECEKNPRHKGYMTIFVDPTLRELRPDLFAAENVTLNLRISMGQDIEEAAIDSITINDSVELRG